MAFLFHQKRGSPKVKKSHFYVWFLGAQEATGLKGCHVTLPAIRLLLQESFRTPPTKVTLQINDKGVKIVQVAPTVNKHGKIKMELLKFMVPYISISDVQLSPPPYDDTIAVVFLILNPETRCPIHVHVYRCDSSDTAKRLFASLQMLVDKPDNRKRFADLEQRLITCGLLPDPTQKRRQIEDTKAFEHDVPPKVPPKQQKSKNSMAPDQPSTRQIVDSPPSTRPPTQAKLYVANRQSQSNRESYAMSESSLISEHIAEQFDFLKDELSEISDISEDDDYAISEHRRKSKSEQCLFTTAQYENSQTREDIENRLRMQQEIRKAKKVAKMHEAVFQELKEKLDYSKDACPLLLPPKDYDKTVRKRGPDTKRKLAETNNKGRVSPSGLNTRLDESNASVPFIDLHWSSSSTSGFGSDLSPDGAAGSKSNKLFESVDRNESSKSKFNDEGNGRFISKKSPESFRRRSDFAMESTVSSATNDSFVFRRNRISSLQRSMSPPIVRQNPPPLPQFPKNPRHSIALAESSVYDDFSATSRYAGNGMFSKHFDNVTPESKSSSHSKNKAQSALRMFGDTLKFQSKHSAERSRNKKPSSDNSNSGQRGRMYAQKQQQTSSNWITRKPSRPVESTAYQDNNNLAKKKHFASCENLSYSANLLNGQVVQPSMRYFDSLYTDQHQRGTSNGQNGKSSSLWHLPTVVNSFENTRGPYAHASPQNQAPLVLPGYRRRWQDAKWSHADSHGSSFAAGYVHHTPYAFYAGIRDSHFDDFANRADLVAMRRRSIAMP